MRASEYFAGKTLEKQDITKLNTMIQTAEETLSIICPSYKYALETGRQQRVTITGENAKTALIEFAKLHVTAALKAAADTPNEISGELRTYDDCYFIINSYPLNNIK